MTSIVKLCIAAGYFNTVAVTVGVALTLAPLPACHPGPPTPPAPTWAPTTADDCTAACNHLRTLGCEEGKPTPNGASCESWCNEYRVTAAGVDPVCMSKVATCPDVDHCGR